MTELQRFREGCLDWYLDCKEKHSEDGKRYGFSRSVTEEALESTSNAKIENQIQVLKDFAEVYNFGFRHVDKIITISYSIPEKKRVS